MEQMQALDNPLVSSYLGFSDFLFSSGHERFFSRVVRFDTEEIQPLGSSGDTISAGILETGVKISSMNSHSVTLTVTYELLFNSGSNSWTAHVADANWWLLQRVVAAKRRQGFTVLFNQKNIVTDVKIEDMREGLVPQDSKGLKSTLKGWNTFAQLAIDLTIALTDFTVGPEI